MDNIQRDYLLTENRTMVQILLMLLLLLITTVMKKHLKTMSELVHTFYWVLRSCRGEWWEMVGGGE